MWFYDQNGLFSNNIKHLKIGKLFYFKTYETHLILSLIAYASKVVWLWGRKVSVCRFYPLFLHTKDKTRKRKKKWWNSTILDFFIKCVSVLVKMSVICNKIEFITNIIYIIEIHTFYFYTRNLSQNTYILSKPTPIYNGTI